ncbi:MAG: hypothetical protein ACJ764_07285 [Solirubrobacteraceae bacterium]
MVFRGWALIRLAGLALVCLLAVGCGGSSSGPPPVHSARQLCIHVRGTAARLLGGSVAARVTDPDLANIECVLSAPGIRIDVVAEASPRAWSQYDATVVHQSQAFGSTAAPKASDLPINLGGLGFNAAWIPQKQQLVATNATQSTGGSFVTVTITRSSRRGPSSERLAKAVATETLAVAPKGPSPGPPPN